MSLVLYEYVVGLQNVDSETANMDVFVIYS
jgi:hypothetical protein